jgi:uncharacterized phage protein (TIGR01671 family)
MSRPIKFRTWSNYHKKFVINDGEFGLSRLFENYSVGLDKYFSHNNDYETPNYIGGYVVQQFTGLSDVKGKDIYEGDIVLAHNYRYPYDVLRCVVEFSQHSASFFLRHVKESNVSLSFSHCGSRVNTEIIGNIFEDAKLLG